MKLTILGGGGFRVPLVYRAVAGSAGAEKVTRITLYDVAAERLGAIQAVLAQLCERAANPPDVEATTDLDRALEGADFVFSALRVGGLAGRVADERVALDLGVLGQETTGPGGIAYGLRTIPLALHIAERVRACAPRSWFINFTNPAGMITEVMRSVLGERVIGICDSPMGLAMRAQRALGVRGATIDYAGLNHLGWLQGLHVDGRDRLGELLADEAALATTEEGQLFGTPWLQTLGAIPNEYLYYYYFTRDAIAAIKGGAQTRGEYLLAQQEEFYRRVAAAPDDALAVWDAVRLERNSTYMREARGADHVRDDDDIEGGGYEGVAVALMSALAGGPAATLILNVANRGALAGLDDEAVVEVPCRVDRAGPVPCSVSPLAGERLGLVEQVKAVDRLVIEASTTRSPRRAIQAFAVHPLVDSVRVAETLFSDYRRRIPELDEVFR